MTRFPLRKILFDLDGTLVDTAGDLHAATNHALQSVGREKVSLDIVRPYVGFGALKLLEIGLNHTGGITSSASPEALRATFLDYYQSNISDFSEVYPGGLELLMRLREAGIQIAICTNKAEGLARKLLEDIDIIDYFPVILGGDTLIVKKPDPRHLTTALDLLEGNGPAVMVGDSSPDILAAKAAKIPVIAATYGYQDTDILSLKPDAVASSLAEVADFLEF